ncbi:conserved protein of unknown function (plasmid) [Cupriavidus taiwanensis]|nr:hypothetical protein CBM2585_P30025 [Cupriavidus taiwanensis]SOZ40595.1 hypothetical protein CBM2605_P30025 [Cupriavidus neocaledonicus]SOZ21514.1 hypothetical protein CBM2604_P30021 [Cupriavidus taiwanensis]SOZ51181.1 hypothetical protein CBM2610_P30021 [Cupriavidus taiwanensis]SPA37328.1 hypothetical protein CBM2623_P30023 [Cupriavidus taiwanensis]
MSRVMLNKTLPHVAKSFWLIPYTATSGDPSWGAGLGMAWIRPASVCTILFLLVARQVAVSEAPGTILCQGILLKIVPPADVLSNFVPLPTARSVAGGALRLAEPGTVAVRGCRAITVPSRGHADGVGGGYRHALAASQSRPLAGPMGPGTKFCKIREQYSANRRWRFRLLHKQSQFDITPDRRFFAVGWSVMFG